MDQPTMPQNKTADLIVDYIRRGPASIKHVASHFGMRLGDVHEMLSELQNSGRIKPIGYHYWKIANNE